LTGPGSYGLELSYALAAAERAADLLRDAFHTGYMEKHDRAAEERIHEVLTSVFPFYGYRGEELGLRLRPRDERKHLWLVDPHDGTSAAVAGFRGAAVSIALLREGLPVLGVVCAYAAPDDSGDLFWWAEGNGLVRRNGREVKRAWPSKPSNECTVLVSHHADRNAAVNAELVHPMRYRAVPGLAYRLALVAAGEGDLAVSINAPVGWDFAAGHALLVGAGAGLYTEKGVSVTYDATGQARCGPVCLGGARSLVDALIGRDLRKAARGSGRGNEERTLCRPSPGRTVENSGILSRAQGCLLGQMAGDALGSLVEFQSPRRIRSLYGDGPRRLEDGGTWSTIAGQPTDDSELALALARCIVDAGRYDREAAAKSYAKWYASEPFDIGNATREALSAAARHLHLGDSVACAAAAAANRTTQANGGLMRSSPIGIFGSALDLDALVGLAHDDAALTHPSVICRDANAVFTMAIALAIRTGYGASGTLAQVMAAAERLDICQPVRKCLASAKQGPPADYLTHEGWVLVALQNAFYQMLRAESFERGIVDTVRQGGDTDTNAAIAGALLGAVWGRDAIPIQWRDRILTCRPLRGLAGVLRPRPAVYWPVDALCLAEQLVVAGMHAAHAVELPVPEDIQAEYIGDRAMIVRLAFEEASALGRLALAGKPENVQYMQEPQLIRQAAGMRGIEKLELALRYFKDSFVTRVSAGEAAPTVWDDVPGAPPDPYDGRRYYPLGQEIHVVLSLEEGHALMEFAKAADVSSPLRWQDGTPDDFHQQAGRRAIGSIYQAGMEAIRRHRLQTGMPGYIRGTFYNPLDELMNAPDDTTC
jgi:ADP-ribosyl-[dinitrogen reductase] hydrolase